MIAFRKTKEPNGWMGSMAPFSITHDDKVWATSEHLFQALRFSNPEIREEIRLLPSPMAAKWCARKHIDKMTTTPRSEADLGNMLMVLRLKIQQHPNLKEQLIATGDEVIVEDVTNRQNDSGLFWGAAIINGELVGKNILGHLWMRVRGEVLSIESITLKGQKE